MDTTITQRKRPLIKNFAVLSLIMLLTPSISSCKSEHVAQKRPEPGVVVANFKDYETKALATPAGKLIKAYLARSEQQQTQGLSGVKPSELADNEAMLFWYEKPGLRNFWMPNTYTDLDIFFLTEDFEVIHVERKVKAHPGMKEPPRIARTPTVYAHHVLELKATSPLSQEIKKGMKLIPVSGGR
jgi:uncharacterized membrane protein (UPF0127 family)